MSLSGGSAPGVSVGLWSHGIYQSDAYQCQGSDEDCGECDATVVAVHIMPS